MLKPIILGYEKIKPITNEGWNFNGRITPSEYKVDQNTFDNWNNYIKSVYYELLEPDINHSYGYKHSIIFNSRGTVSNEFLRCKVELLKDQKYFYVIEPIHIQTYVNYTSHISISEKVLDDIRYKNAYLIFYYPNEGDVKKYLYAFRNLVLRLNLPKNKIYLCHGDFNVEKFANEPYMYHPINWSPHLIRDLVIENPIEYSPKYLFNCYNRNIREHRFFTVGWLKKNDLIDKGYVSFGQMNKNEFFGYSKHFLKELGEDTIEFMRNFLGSSPDNKCLVNDNLYISVEKDHYVNSFVSLISESEGNHDDIWFFTEKTYKSIILGHPFIYLAGKNQLKKLKEFGFKTFDKWYDESYDSIDGCVNRIKQITLLLKQLLKLSTNELIEIRKDMLPTLIHNQNVFKEMITDRKYFTDTEIKNFLTKLNE